MKDVKVQYDAEFSHFISNVEKGSIASHSHPEDIFNTVYREMSDGELYRAIKVVNQVVSDINTFNKRAKEDSFGVASRESNRDLLELLNIANLYFIEEEDEVAKSIGERDFNELYRIKSMGKIACDALCCIEEKNEAVLITIERVRKMDLDSKLAKNCNCVIQ